MAASMRSGSKLFVRGSGSTGNAVAPAYDEALAKIQNADSVNADETSWRESNKLAWLWAAVTPLLKVFRIDKRRNREAFRKLLFNFDGW